MNLAERSLVSAGISLVFGLMGAEPSVDLEDLPRVPPTEPDAARATFQVKPGFRIELAAAEPVVVDPIAVSFDELGRMFVVEMRDYSERRDERLGRVRMLEDRDGDGRFERSSVWVEGLPWPTAVICYGGGVFVGAVPDILFCRDTDGDGKADVREVVFTGFSSDYAPYATNRLNVQSLLNSFTWGLDNRIHGSASMSGGKVLAVRHPDLPAVDLRGRDFSFDPRELTLRAESGGGQHGMTFDSRGRKFVCSNSAHIRQVLYPNRYADLNPWYPLPSAAADIAIDGPAAEVFRISPDEPWRVIRTRWRVAGQVPGPIEGGGRPSGYFTGATGIMIYRGDAWPAEFEGDAFIADCGSNLVHRKKLRAAGVEMRAERPADERGKEFLASRDNWFRPVQLANGPDGNLYVVDMYREVIEHPWSLPPPLKQHLDLNSGNDRGRIYRIAPENFISRRPVRWRELSSAELAGLLDHSNGWHRDTAARLIFERQDPSAVPALDKVLRDGRTAWGRLHAIHALEGMKALKPGHVLGALSDADDAVREHGVRLAEQLLRRGLAAGSRTALEEALARLSRDESPTVRYRLAFTANELTAARKVEALERLSRESAEDAWIRAAIVSAAGEEAERLFDRLRAPDWAAPGTDLRALLQDLARVLGTRSAENPGPIPDWLGQAGGGGLELSLARCYLEGRRSRGLSAPMIGLEMRPLFNRALELAEAPGSSPDAEGRLEAIALLGEGGLAEGPRALIKLVGSDPSPAIQRAAVRALVRFPGAVDGAELLAKTGRALPEVRTEIIAAVLRRRDWTPLLVAALEEGRIQRGVLTPVELDALRKHPDAAVRARIERVIGRPTSREDAVVRFRSALEVAGDAARGRKIFQERCATCHRLAGEGAVVGPDLATVRAAGKEILLTQILDPNREVQPQYRAHLVETSDGEVLTGLLVRDSASSLTLRAANGIESTFSRAQLAKVRVLEQSLMPEGLEADLKPRDLADLIEFILTARD